jgi:hypothetical protein
MAFVLIVKLIYRARSHEHPVSTIFETYKLEL